MGKFTTIILLLFSGLLSAQCLNKNIEISYVKDSCKVIQMETKTFAYYWQVEKNLGQIRDSLPALYKTLKKERESKSKLIKGLDKQLAISDQEKTILLKSKEECNIAMVELEVESSYWESKYDNMVGKPLNRFLLGLGVGVIGSAIVVAKK